MTGCALSSYNLNKSLCWGNCAGHFQKASTGPWSGRVVHVIIALFEAIPLIGQIISLFEWAIVSLHPTTKPAAPRSGGKPVTSPEVSKPAPLTLQAVIDGTPFFEGYKVYVKDGGKRDLLSLSIRPANLFFDAANIQTIRPGGGLFAITDDHSMLRTRLEGDRSKVVEFTAQGNCELESLYGSKRYRISYEEIIETLNSQEIFLSKLLPLQFYQGLKAAMLNDGIVILPRCSLNEYMVQNPGSYITLFLAQCGMVELLDYSFWALGSQVVKVENFYIFMNERGQILQRIEGANDAIRLISMCGIRPGSKLDNSKEFMKNAYITAFAAAGTGIVVFPAVGMGVWGGNPEIYWNAFFEALLASPSVDSLDAICVNPAHTGEVFNKILQKFKNDNKSNPRVMAKLSRVIYVNGKDVVHLAYRLKLHFPEKKVSLVNASDPDVTLGFHVGEYVNNIISCCTTTEENYTAMGTNGLCFETLTGVHLPGADRVHSLTY